jgi:nucleoside phosphorylase
MVLLLQIPGEIMLALEGVNVSRISPWPPRSHFVPDPRCEAAPGAFGFVDAVEVMAPVASPAAYRYLPSASIPNEHGVLSVAVWRGASTRWWLRTRISRVVDHPEARKARNLLGTGASDLRLEIPRNQGRAPCRPLGPVPADGKMRRYTMDSRGRRWTLPATSPLCGRPHVCELRSWPESKGSIMSADLIPAPVRIAFVPFCVECLSRSEIDRVFKAHGIGLPADSNPYSKTNLVDAYLSALSGGSVGSQQFLAITNSVIAIAKTKNAESDALRTFTGVCRNHGLRVKDGKLVPADGPHPGHNVESRTSPLETFPGAGLLGDGDREKFGDEYLNSRTYLSPNWEIGHGRDTPLAYTEVGAVWKDIFGHKGFFETKRVVLDRMYLTDWVPRSPGQYHTTGAAKARDDARHYLITDQRRRAVLTADSDENLEVFDPYGKHLMMRGGVGCHRLTLKRVAGAELKLLGVTSTGVPHDGLVVALPPELYRKVGGPIDEYGAIFCWLTGQVRFLPKPNPSGDDLFFRWGTGIPRMFVQVDDLRVLQAKPLPRHWLHVTAAVTFRGEVHGRQGDYFTYGYFNPAQPGGIEQCVEWIKNRYVAGLYNGQVLTDFDEQSSWFEDSHPVISLRYATSPDTPAQELAARVQAAFGIPQQAFLRQQAALSIHGDVSIVNVTGPDNIVLSQSPGSTMDQPRKPRTSSTAAKGKEASHRAVVLTALKVEYDAARKHLRNLTEETHRAGTVYEVGFFQGQHPWSVAIVEAGKGNVNAALEALRAIDRYLPQVVFFMGVAGGLKDDVGLGDVVPATKVYGFEYGKAEKTFKPRGEAHNAAYALEQRARAVARTPGWLKRVKHSAKLQRKVADYRNDKAVLYNPKAVVGPIAAGEKVVASTSSITHKTLAKHYSDALAVEMEGFGFLKAVHISNPVLAMVVRGISDTIDDKAGTDKLGWQEIASANAAGFIFEILAQLT